MTSPDTRLAVATELNECGLMSLDQPNPVLIADIAVAADRKALAEQGYTVASLEDIAKARAFEKAVQKVAEELIGPFGDQPYEEGVEGAYRDISQLLMEELVLARQSLGLPIEVTE
jgi:hypothetical protein